MRKASKAIYRRFTQIIADKDSDISPQRRRGRRELIFCLSGDDDKQNNAQIRAGRFCPIVVYRLDKKGFPQRTLRLCGNILKGSSFCVHLRRSAVDTYLRAWRLGAKSFIKVVL